MKQSFLTLTLFVTLLIVGGVAVFLFQSRTTMESEIAAAADAQAELEATLVQVFAESRAADATRTAEQAALDNQIGELEATVAELLPLATRAEQLANAPTPTPSSNPLFEEDAPPQIRIILRERESVWPVGEPLDIIASATHPIGIAVLNITVDGETLISDSPFDPRMNIVTTRWTPTEPGIYLISAVATTIRGRASDPVTIELLVVDESDQAAINESILRRIERHIEDLRGLEPQEEIIKLFVTSSDLSSLIQSELFDDYSPEDAVREVQILSMFDFIPDDYPLYETTLSTLSSAVAGFYESDSNTMYVVNDDDELDDEERLTHAHEYLHALQDQYFDISLLEGDDLNRDERLALRSLGEGEAELTEFLYQSRGYLTGEQKADSSPVFPTPVADDVPDFFLSDFNFPYVRGYAFVSTFFEEGGYESIDRLWDNRPTSSEQIIHPDRFKAGDVPIEVALPAISTALPAGWELLDENVFGEFYTRLYLGLYLDDSALIDEAATGWGGDRYAVYRSPTGERLLFLKLVWDSPNDHAQFLAAYATWADQRMDSDQISTADGLDGCWVNQADHLCLFDTGAETVIVRTDSRAALDAVRPLVEP